MPSRLTVDMSAFESLSDAVKKQVPFAVSKGINAALKDAKREVIRQIPLKLDRPKTFSAKSAIDVTSSNKKERPISGSVFIKDIQAAYLKWQIEGGTQTKTDNPISPVNAKLNKKHGNIIGLRKSSKKPIWKKNKHFIAKIRGVTGLWLRYKRKGKKGKGKVKLILAMRDSKTYKKGRLPFYKIAEGVLRTRLPRRINEELTVALRDRRR